jgi:hypothetical protein
LSGAAFGHNLIPCAASVSKVPETRNRWGVRHRLKGSGLRRVIWFRDLRINDEVPW